MFKNKTILVTGGTGSFGQKFVEIVLKECNPKSIRVLSRGELLQKQMNDQFGDDDRLRFFIGDVRDKNRLHRAISGVDVIVHAAALKQVPTCEYNPWEAIQTNIIGTMNVVDEAIDNSVENAILVSSDKGVYPVNLYGATKMVAEKLFVQGNVYIGQSVTKLSAVRYGNVLGSRGSIIPVLNKQKINGEITITDERMTRFWISLEQGVEFVILCLNRMQGGEIFVPKIPSMTLTDLADVVAPKAKRKIIGIRTGEKLHETLITSEEARHTKEFDDFYVIEPENRFWGELRLEGGKQLPDNFTYSSDTNTLQLTVAELKEKLLR